MIPRLPEVPRPDEAVARFVAALAEIGFSGDASAEDGDRMVFATDNSIYRLPPQAILFPRGTEDVARIMRLLAQERFRSVVLAPRGGGTGTTLMRRAEEIARQRDCIGMWLDPYSFQARGFYEKLGFTVFGQVDDHPPGEQRFFLQKRFAP